MENSKQFSIKKYTKTKENIRMMKSSNELSEKNKNMSENRENA